VRLQREGEAVAENAGKETATLSGGCFWCLEDRQDRETPSRSMNEPAMTGAESRPWEQLGQAPRDAEPHRGPSLLLLATLSVVCGFLSCCFVVPSLIGLPLAAAVLTLSARDLTRMRAGMVDRRGYGLTEAACSRSTMGLIVSLAVVTLFVCFIIRLLLVP
jgi:hypothetical protein